ncbi:prolyl oligopeptidase family serine peptidase [Nonomuraea diastatica]|uniref:prolyl oligopeptidase n=1 Tax=Nonomuraea diastatica TaxID=1848329 RepID=A0A4R4X3A7_9ACTN|nr:prolyl oligopeptidase family serine peptidase [Nonomuraea diastatica]TDD24750.1 S9 family peptidase [Nonomuraea diastatica]
MSTDPYEWLRPDTDESLAWQEQQDAAARSHVRGWDYFAQVRDQLAAGPAAPGAPDSLGTTTPRRLGGRWFRLAPASPERAALGLWVSTSSDEPGRLLVDPHAAGYLRDGEPAQLVWYEPTPDGTRVVFGVHHNGEMIGLLRVVDTATGRDLPIGSHRHMLTGAVPGWLPDGSGFYVCDRSETGRHQVWHVPVDPPGEIGVAVNVIAPAEFTTSPSGLTPQVSPGGRWVITLTGQHEQVASHLGDRRTGTWRSFPPKGYEGECHGVWYDENTYIAVVTGDAPRGRLVAIPAETSADMRTWRELVPESDAVLRCVTLAGKHLVLCEVTDAVAGFRLVTADGKPAERLTTPGLGSSPTAMVSRRFERSEEVTFSYTTFLDPLTPYRYDPERGEPVAIGAPRPGMDAMTVAQRFATSPDGTRVPYFVVHRADLDLDRPQPALINGYGGFNVAWLPRFLGNYAPFLRAGGVYVHAILRGGAEYGRTWYEDGRLSRKQNTFDDLYAIAEDLIDTGLSEPARLAFHGASHGGLLAGVALVQRPDLWRAMVAEVPLFDMLHPLTSDHPAPQAVRSVFLEDYGDPDEPGDAAIIRAYSPYHNIEPGTAYPALLQAFGEHDLGCQPFHGRLFTAKLAHASTSGHPILLRVWKGAGHAALDSAEVSDHAAEMLAFLMRELNMTPT